MADQIRARLLAQLNTVQSYQSIANVNAAKRLALTDEVQDQLEIDATILVSVNQNLDDRDALAMELL